LNFSATKTRSIDHDTLIVAIARDSEPFVHVTYGAAKAETFIMAFT
jgi:hypothetical protein